MVRGLICDTTHWERNQARAASRRNATTLRPDVRGGSSETGTGTSDEQRGGGGSHDGASLGADGGELQLPLSSAANGGEDGNAPAKDERADGTTTDENGGGFAGDIYDAYDALLPQHPQPPHFFPPALPVPPATSTSSSSAAGALQQEERLVAAQSARIASSGVGVVALDVAFAHRCSPGTYDPLCSRANHERHRLLQRLPRTGHARSHCGAPPSARRSCHRSGR